MTPWRRKKRAGQEDEDLHVTVHCQEPGCPEEVEYERHAIIYSSQRTVALTCRQGHRNLYRL
jgi:hypothetical protein